MYIGVVTINVNDQERAKEFYTKKLGWEVEMDESMGEKMRWLTVKPRGEKTSFVLAQGFGDWTPEKVGGMTGVVLEVDDVFKTAEELKKNGVEFRDEPKMEFFGGWAVIKDSEGNEFGLHSPATVGAPSNN
ncbi:MAG TPA: VOC family protein [Candidatus Rubrimentiphilum sp.]|nr:VOC family protein [Candidatus Rubrimentiphilum sp.]